jgi:hypothetical protein
MNFWKISKEIYEIVALDAGSSIDNSFKKCKKCTICYLHFFHQYKPVLRIRDVYHGFEFFYPESRVKKITDLDLHQRI